MSQGLGEVPRGVREERHSNIYNKPRSYSHRTEPNFKEEDIGDDEREGRHFAEESQETQHKGDGREQHAPGRPQNQSSTIAVLHQ